VETRLGLRRAGAAKGTRRVEARRQARRTAARGRRRAFWRHALPLWGMPQWGCLYPGNRGLQRQAN